MKKRRHSEEQIVGILQQYEAGAKMFDLRREYGVSVLTLHAWRRKFGGMSVSEAVRLTAMEEEFCRLNIIVAEAEVARRGTKNGRRILGSAPQGDLQDDFAKLARRKLQALRLRRSRSRA
jgi:putative transposase